MTRQKLVASTIALVALFIALPSRPAAAQELDCNVQVNYQLLTGNDFNFLKELEERIGEYMNARAWTGDSYQDYERINCTLQLTFEEAISLTSFRARLVVAMRRPIYGTMQSSTVVQFNDASLQFNYTRGAPLMFDLERYDPLTSVLDFYAFIMLGYDYDTFSQFGGTPHFEKARRIADRAQSLGAQGWAQVGNDQGRYSLITQVMDPRFRPLRRAYFDYHFNGLDRFVRETEEARRNVITVLEVIEQLQQDVSRSYAVDLFFSSKYQELAAIFEKSPVRGEAYALLSQVDPAHMTEYNRLTQ